MLPTVVKIQDIHLLSRSLSENEVKLHSETEGPIIVYHRTQIIYRGSLESFWTVEPVLLIFGLSWILLYLH